MIKRIRRNRTNWMPCAPALCAAQYTLAASWRVPKKNGWPNKRMKGQISWLCALIGSIRADIRIEKRLGHYADGNHVEIAMAVTAAPGKDGCAPFSSD